MPGKSQRNLSNKKITSTRQSAPAEMNVLLKGRTSKTMPSNYASATNLIRLRTLSLENLAFSLEIKSLIYVIVFSIILDAVISGLIMGEVSAFFNVLGFGFSAYAFHEYIMYQIFSLQSKISIKNQSVDDFIKSYNIDKEISQVTSAQKVLFYLQIGIFILMLGIIIHKGYLLWNIKNILSSQIQATTTLPIVLGLFFLKGTSWHEFATIFYVLKKFLEYINKIIKKDFKYIHNRRQAKQLELLNQLSLISLWKTPQFQGKQTHFYLEVNRNAKLSFNFGARTIELKAKTYLKALKKFLAQMHIQLCVETDSLFITSHHLNLDETKLAEVQHQFEKELERIYLCQSNRRNIIEQLEKLCSISAYYNLSFVKMRDAKDLPIYHIYIDVPSAFVSKDQIYAAFRECYGDNKIHVKDNIFYLETWKPADQGSFEQGYKKLSAISKTAEKEWSEKLVSQTRTTLQPAATEAHIQAEDSAVTPRKKEEHKADSNNNNISEVVPRVVITKQMRLAARLNALKSKYPKYSFFPLKMPFEHEFDRGEYFAAMDENKVKTCLGNDIFQQMKSHLESGIVHGNTGKTKVASAGAVTTDEAYQTFGEQWSHAKIKVKTIHNQRLFGKSIKAAIKTKTGNEEQEVDLVVYKMNGSNLHYHRGRR